MSSVKRLSQTWVLPCAGEYDLEATLTSGQAFRWRRMGPAWIGVIGRHWVQVETVEEGLRCQTVDHSQDGRSLALYFQTELDLSRVLAAFPPDRALAETVRRYRGLRLLRQDPWECLASFLLSANKQITHIQQIVAELCRRFGEPVAVPPGADAMFSFPSPGRLAACSEGELRACKMGFRAPNLLAAARLVNGGDFCLEELSGLPLNAARARLLTLPGVGPKIADCVLLFAYDFPTAFPVDVWVAKALQQLYFHRRQVSLKECRTFAEVHFGPYAGYAQQYLFHYMRVHAKRWPGGPAPSLAS